MKLRSYTLLFSILSFLSDKTNGASFFVKYKLLLGTLILGITSVSGYKSKKEIMCYVQVTEVPVESQMAYTDSIAPSAQNHLTDIELKGTVKDKSGEPLPGASITIKGKRLGVATDLNGDFSLRANQNDTLLISYVGYFTQELLVSTLKDNKQIILEENENGISCYIVIEAESVKKKEILNPVPESRLIELEVKGVVLDQDGYPLPRTGITIKNSNRGVFADEDGKFSLKAKSVDILKFSFIGFDTQEIAVSDLKENEPIRLKESENVLCYEVVVVASPPVRKTTILCYSVTTIDDSKDKGRKKYYYNELQTPPVSPVGDRGEFQKWMERNLVYSETMKSSKIEGQLLLSFSIDKKGKIGDKMILSKLSPEADAEALRVLSASGKWKPGEHNGKTVKTIVTLPIQFKLKK